MDTPKKIGRYEILEELGRGAMGVVYRAKDPAMDRVVALKTIISVVLAGPQGAEFRERFYREARTAGAMAHPGIVAVFDVGEHDGMPFLVMEFIAGRTLADAVKKGERLSLERVCEFGGQIAGALGYAHQRGVVHRDIKPANILLTSGEVYGIERPKITDFGVAKLAEGQTTLTGQMLGTPAYMPPEQFTGSPIDSRTDIFSLGVVLYWMATGEQPFPGESVTAVSYKVVHTDPVPPRRLNPAIPAALDAIILKCLSKSPADRYQTGEELARALGELRTGDKAGCLAVHRSDAGRGSGGDPDATLIEAVSLAKVAPAAAPPKPGGAAAIPGPTEVRRESRFVLVAAMAAVVAAGVYFLRSWQSAPVEEEVAPPSLMTEAATTETASVPEPVETGTRTAGATALPAGTPRVVVPAAPAPAPVATAAVSVVEAPAAAAPVLEPAALDFDPRALDRRQNARLEIDAQRMPQDLEFILEMNGKLYFRKTSGAKFTRDDGFYVPPGVQEFRVTAKSVEAEKTSNTVSTDFKANKRNTLNIELRIQGKPAEAGMPQGLYPNSQIVLTLK